MSGLSFNPLRLLRPPAINCIAEVGIAQLEIIIRNSAAARQELERERHWLQAQVAFDSLEIDAALLRGPLKYFHDRLSLHLVFIERRCNIGVLFERACQSNR